MTVNGIIPGLIHTEQLDAAVASRQGKSVEDIVAASRATIPMGRYGKLEEFADAACLLVSARAGYISSAACHVSMAA